MKIIVKPVGLFCLLGTFTVLVAMATWKYTTLPPSGTLSVASAAEQPSNAAAAAAHSAVASAIVAPAGKTSLPPGVLLAPDIASKEWNTYASKGRAVISVVPASVPGHPFARRIAIQATGANPWDIQAAHAVNVALVGGKRIQLSFWARSKEGCLLTAVVEQNADPYTRVVSKQETLTPQWKQYKDVWVQKSNTPDNWAKMDFQMSYKVGTIEITGVSIRQIGSGR